MEKKTEDKIQADCYQWFHETYTHLRGLLYHVPNGKKRDKITSSILKAMGVVKGIPDLVFHYRGKTFFIEMKKEGEGVLSDDQKRIHAILEQHNFEVWVCDNLDDFKRIIISILDRKSFDTEKVISKETFFYNQKVHSFLYSLDGAVVTRIADICEPANISKFIDAVSDFIQSGYGHPEGFEILFTPDYKAFYKKIFT